MFVAAMTHCLMLQTESDLSIGSGVVTSVLRCVVTNSEEVNTVVL